MEGTGSQVGVASPLQGVAASLFLEKWVKPFFPRGRRFHKCLILLPISDFRKTRYDIMGVMNTKHTAEKFATEAQARRRARKRGKEMISIVFSFSGGFQGMRKGEAGVYYLEPDDEGTAWIRTWERLIYEGPGVDA